MPHTPEQRRLWKQKPEVRARLRESDRKYYRSRGKKRIEERRSILAPFPCITCGEPEPACIDWHHIDDSEKSFNIATGMGRGIETWWDEILKCVPLCANCHRKLHNNLLCLIHQPIPTR